MSETKLNGYVAMWRRKRCEVYAETALQARNKAQAIFKARKGHEITVVLAEKNGEDVIHIPVF